MRRFKVNIYPWYRKIGKKGEKKIYNGEKREKKGKATVDAKQSFICHMISLRMYNNMSSPERKQV